MKAAAHGIAWYRNKEEYDRLLAIFEDADQLPRTFDEWRIKAEKALEAIKATQARPVKVIIDPDEFPKWCSANGYTVNTQGRMAYGNLVAMRAVHDN